MKYLKNPVYGNSYLITPFPKYRKHTHELAVAISVRTRNDVEEAFVAKGWMDGTLQKATAKTE